MVEVKDRTEEFHRSYIVGFGYSHAVSSGVIPSYIAVNG